MYRLHGLKGSLSTFFAVIFMMVILLVEAEENKLVSSDGSQHDSQPHEVDKRYMAALAKSGRLPKFLVSQKRLEDSAEENPNAESASQDHFIPDLSDAWQNDKRHIGAFLKVHGNPALLKPRNNRESPVGLPPSSLENEQSSEDSLDNSSPGELQKRNVASLARLGRLNPVRYGSFAPRSGAGSKRVYVYDDHMSDGSSVAEEAVEAEEGEDDCEEDDRGNNSQDNRINPSWTQQKRYLAALARSGRLPVWHTQRSWWGGKRDKPSPYWMTYRSGARPYGNKRVNTSSPNELSENLKNKRCKRSQGLSLAEKRNLAMLARKGLLPLRPYASA